MISVSRTINGKISTLSIFIVVFVIISIVLATDMDKCDRARVQDINYIHPFCTYLYIVILI
jgi:hypothetical protein